MTTIYRIDITNKNRKRELIEKVKDIKYLGKILEYVDLRKTTANSNFVDIKFKDEKQWYMENYNRISDAIYIKEVTKWQSQKP